MNKPDFTLDKIKFATDGSTFEKAVALYENGKVAQVREGIRSYTAVVMGTKPYRVSVEARNFRYASCSCYLGENGTYCKHMLALAIYVVKDGEPLSDSDKKIVQNPSCSGRLGNLTESELATVKQTIAAALRYIKAYVGPSRRWFAYQDSLAEGCNRLSAIVADIPVSPQTAQLLVDLLIRLDKKLCTGGVDDSDGEVGGFIEEVVGVLQEFVRLDPSCTTAFEKLKNRETCFDWEKPLLGTSE